MTVPYYVGYTIPIKAHNSNRVKYSIAALIEEVTEVLPERNPSLSSLRPLGLSMAEECLNKSVIVGVGEKKTEHMTASTLPEG